MKPKQKAMLTHELGDGYYLERVETRHAEPFFAVISNHRQRLGHWEAWPWCIKSLADCRAWIGRLRDEDARDEGAAFGIWQGRELVGMAALADISAAQLAATYWGFVCPHVEGRGVADRATRVTVDYAFQEIGLERINWFCAERNHASRGLAARLGFRFNGLLPSYEVIQDRFVDFVLYSMLAGDWQQARADSERLPVRRVMAADQSWIKRLAGRPINPPAWVIARKGVLQTRWTAGGMAEITALAVAAGKDREEIAARLIEMVGNRLRQQGAKLLVLRLDGDRRRQAFLRKVAGEHGFHELQPQVWVKGL